MLCQEEANDIYLLSMILTHTNPHCELVPVRIRFTEQQSRSTFTASVTGLVSKENGFKMANAVALYLETPCYSCTPTNIFISPRKMDVYEK